MSLDASSQRKKALSPLGQYLSTLNDFERGEFASACGTSNGYLIQISGGFRKASAEMAMKIAAASQYQVTPHLLRPDLYPNPTDALPLTIATTSDAHHVQGGAV